MNRVTNPNPPNPAFSGESRIVDSPTRDLTPPGTSRSHNGSAIPNSADAALNARADALMTLGWRFDPAGVMGDGTVRYQATAPNGIAVIDTDGGFAACVTLAENRRF